MSLTAKSPGGPSSPWPGPDDDPGFAPRTHVPRPRTPGRVVLEVVLGILGFSALMVVIVIALSLMFAGGITGSHDSGPPGAGFSQDDSYYAP